jgi:anthranilate phosphoribosyltransferase
MAPEGLRRLMQQIQVVDYELHAAFRVIARGEMQPEHIAAFMDASVTRDRMMARVLSYVAEMHKQAAYRAISASRNGNGIESNR